MSGRFHRTVHRPQGYQNSQLRSCDRSCVSRNLARSRMRRSRVRTSATSCSTRGASASGDASAGVLCFAMAASCAAQRFFSSASAASLPLLSSRCSPLRCAVHAFCRASASGAARIAAYCAQGT